VQRCQVLGPWLRLVGSLRTAHSQLKLTSSGSFPRVGCLGCPVLIQGDVTLASALQLLP